MMLQKRGGGGGGGLSCSPFEKKNPCNLNSWSLNPEPAPSYPRIRNIR